MFAGAKITSPEEDLHIHIVSGLGNAVKKRHWYGKRVEIEALLSILQAPPTITQLVVWQPQAESPRHLIRSSHEE